MISFVWSARYPFLAGAGGSENYTAGHIRELTRRGIPARLITLGHGSKDGRKDFPDIEFLALKDKKELEDLDDTIVFVTYPLDVHTKHQSYAILHCPPPSYARNDNLYNLKAFRGKKLIATSKFSAGLWRRYLKGETGRIHTVYPFASPDLAEVSRPNAATSSSKPARVLFAGRLTPDKGIYTLLSALHMDALKGHDYKLTVTASGAHTEEGKVIYSLVKAHPGIRVVPAQKTAKDMARLMATHDIVVMPSTDIYWQEMFGIVSVEAQHAGCRVVASRSGGLPETNVGGLMLVQPDNPKALAQGIVRAMNLGPLMARERAKATGQFTLAASVDSLLKVVNYQGGYVKRPVIPLRRARLLPGLRPLLTQTKRHA